MLWLPKLRVEFVLAWYESAGLAASSGLDDWIDEFSGACGDCGGMYPFYWIISSNGI